ncbi:MAG: outer membrane beta-barrel protein [Alphaproteobacteria bacterium]|nr:outer membrane beta-barrel protein [Alphaproteobacteria bacterium]MBU1548362.1 outer membrane beta-barrel protein [Alphaproteobacteria bacterium]MBU2390729.1 outer membrane beta-barrel protein [Alphaproteobacteria bacterium]
MTVMKQQGGRQALHRQAVAILLACSTLSAPAMALAQTLYPAPAEPQERNIYSPTNPVNNDGREGTWATAPAIGVTPLRTRPAMPATSSNASAEPASALLSGTSTDPTAAATDITDATDPASLTTGAVTSGNSTPVNDPPYAEDLNQPYPDLLDPPADDPATEEAATLPGDPTGIRLGTLLLRPSIGQSINRETIRDGGTETKRNYLGTTIRGTLTSDWSRHQLSVTGETVIERNLGGGEQPKPEGQIDANLRLDLADETIANISAGYDFEREDNSDPNAIGGASAQSAVQQFNGGLTLERDAGTLRGLAGLGISREIYGDAELQDGSRLDLSDRDHTLVDGRLRLGYELSPALIPFVEVRGGRNFYDRTQDSAGYERSSWTYGGRGGVEFDLSEKLRGELGLGYERVEYDDSRLAALDGLTVDGRTVWSPKRGTELELALRTTLQDATAPGASGWVEYNLAATLTHQLRHNLVGRLTGGATERVFPQASDETNWISGAGLTWSLSRYLDLTGAVEYEYTDRTGTDTKTLRAGLGLTLRR